MAKITGDLDTLLEFYKYPAEHWIHLRTTNPIESTVATVRLRTKVTKGPGSRAAGIVMVYKLIDAAQARWRAVNGPAPGRPGPRRRDLPQRKLLERTTDIPRLNPPPRRSPPDRRSPDTPRQVLTIPLANHPGPAVNSVNQFENR